jgi:hypothetical protein
VRNSSQAAQATIDAHAGSGFEGSKELTGTAAKTEHNASEVAMVSFESIAPPLFLEATKV